jgi:hypothetical protein
VGLLMDQHDKYRAFVNVCGLLRILDVLSQEQLEQAIATQMKVLIDILMKGVF